MLCRIGVAKKDLFYNFNSFHIRTQIYKILSLLRSGLRKIEAKGGGRILKITSLTRKDNFALGFAILLASSLLMIKGTSSDNQTSILEGFFKNYIEEVSIFTSRAQSAETSQFGLFIGLENQSNYTDSISTLQQTALLSFNSLENDLSDIANTKSNQISQYTVQEGDTISFIASDFGVSINTIIWANNLKDIDSIRPGDELTIPPVNGVIHTVKKGDTIASIAAKYGAQEQEIIAFNGLPANGSLQIGHEVIVPDGKINAPRVNTYNSRTAVIKRFAYLPDLGNYFMPPVTGRNWGYIHGRNGVDIATACGTPIFAAANGTAVIVDAAGWNGGFGKYIKIVHNNGTETIYAHSSKLLINPGVEVEKGQQIALIGSTGRSTGCHLHFEVHGAKNPLLKY